LASVSASWRRWLTRLRALALRPDRLKRAGGPAAPDHFGNRGVDLA
jgi:hypothetical protein